MSPKLIAATAENIRAAANHLVAGGLVAIPTETVYGLAADAANGIAVSKIFKAKSRPLNHPLIVHIGALEQLDYWAGALPEYAHRLTALWPGPLTLVLPRIAAAGDYLTGGQSTIAVRMPNHEATLALLEQFATLGGRGIAAPSANRFGEVSATSAAAVMAGLGEYLDEADLVLDGGDCQVGIESTIVDCTGPNPAILRPGAITAADIEALTDIVVAPPSGEIRVSGSHAKHYSPHSRVLLDAAPESGWGLIAPTEVATPPGVIRLAEPKDTEEYARQLYSALRRADELGLQQLVAMQPVGDGLAAAIRDRLARAAAEHQEAK